MKRFSFSLSLQTILLALLCLNACKGNKNAVANINVVNARISSDPDMLNPISTTTADGRYIGDLIFFSLLGTDPDNYQLTPALAVSRPTISEITSGEFKGGMKMEFEIRPEATWNNGTPVTGYDYVFTLKTILNPKTNCQQRKPYYDWVADVIVDSLNPKKLTVLSNQKYFQIEEYAGGYVLPEYAFDTDKIMRKFSVRDMNSDEKRNALKESPEIEKFADLFNSQKFQREKDGIVGCGPYTLDSWVAGQAITLVRKKIWWGDKIKDNRTFLAIPDKIIFKIINDPGSAVAALKSERIDVLSGIEAKLFEELSKNEAVTKKVKIETPSVFACSYIAFNMKCPKLSDLKVREAIAHCINKKQINDDLEFGRDIPVETFVHPDQKQFNKDLLPFDYNLDKARQLLDAAGWKDSDGDGYRDKIVNGERVKLSLDFKIPSGDKDREQTGIMLKADLKKVGIDLTVTSRDWNDYVQDVDRKNFEVTYGAYTIDPIMTDPKQLWHTSASVTGGSNMTSFGNEETDKLIEDIRSDLKEDTRIAKYKQLEQIIHDEIPCVYMFIPANRMAINKKFEVKTTLIEPGYLYNEFKAVNTPM